jgi:hypothetical protein
MLVPVGVPEGDKNEGVVGDLRYIYTLGYGHFDRTVCYWSVDILFDLTDLVFGNSTQLNPTPRYRAHLQVIFLFTSQRHASSNHSIP